jgi:hypothetical protein
MGNSLGKLQEKIKMLHKDSTPTFDKLWRRQPHEIAAMVIDGRRKCQQGTQSKGSELRKPLGRRLH